MIQSGKFDSSKMDIKKLTNSILIFTIKRLIEILGFLIFCFGLLLFISKFSGNIKLGSSGEYDIRAKKRRTPNIVMIIPEISINLFVMKISIELPIFFISIADESNLYLCII